MADLVYALVRAALPVGARLDPSEGLVALSVRSAWDLLLDAAAFPEGSECVMSAVTHPDMARIARSHGLVVVPVDVDLDTLAPLEVDAALTSRTRVLLVAHLFGGEFDLAPAGEIAHARGVMVVEDRAQAFAGDLRRDEDADVSLFSFGTIKTATALGGAIALVRDAALRERMRERQRAWPAQARSRYTAKVLRIAALALRAPAG